ncbi:hypothetical protein QQ045_003997 [Rhodiola kirilowii]
MNQDPPPELGLFDFDYEFYAPRYFDFTFPESQSDVDEAESWFRTATSYPPSPFVLEMMWNEDLHAAHSQASCMFEQVPSSSSISIVSNTTGCLSAQDDRKNGLASPKSRAKKTSTLPKGSTLMKPTASHLAKLNHRKEVSKSLRPPKHSVKNNEKSLQSSSVQDQASKRQKLESGYLRKVAHLNHHTVFEHKKSTGVTQLRKKSIDPKKVTIPREPKLETARRALIRRRRDIVENDHDKESSTHSFRAHPLNKKILQTPSIALRKRTTPLFSEFQDFHLKTSERATHHSSENAISMPISISISQTDSTVSERSSYANSPTHQRNKATPNVKSQTIDCKESNFSISKKASHIPPTELLFSKLSLISDRQREASQLKLLQTAAQ